jgi:hypothetical protein
LGLRDEDGLIDRRLRFDGIHEVWKADFRSARQLRWGRLSWVRGIRSGAEILRAYAAGFVGDANEVRTQRPAQLESGFYHETHVPSEATSDKTRKQNGGCPRIGANEREADSPQRHWGTKDLLSEIAPTNGTAAFGDAALQFIQSSRR